MICVFDLNKNLVWISKKKKKSKSSFKVNDIFNILKVQLGEN